MKGWTIIAGAALIAGGSASSPAQQAPQPTFAIVGATVLPMTGTDRLDNQTILISGDRIAAVGPRRRVKVPAGVRTIDARGKVLMPGLVDMHVHLAPVPGEAGDAAQRALAVMLAHGVTTARGMAGSPGNLEVRRKIEAGEVAGPRLYAAAPALHDKSAPSADAARAAVRKAKADGYDLIKSHHLTNLAVWQAAQDEARQQGIPTGGHVSSAVGLRRAMASGQQIEHLDGTIAELLPADAPERAEEIGQIPPPPIMALAGKASDADIAKLAQRAASARSWHVPTLGLFEKIVDVDVPTDRLASAPEMRWAPPAAIAQWTQQREQMASGGMTAAEGRAFRDLRRRIVRAFHAAGVPMMPGSDTAQAFHLWGPGLHQEIAAFVAAGIPPIDALRAATVVPRDYFRSLPNGGSALGWKADFGTVQTGARADLILLDGDPTRNLAVLDKPGLVIAGGRLFDRAALTAMLDQAAADAKAPPKP